ncbi:tRNA pseudouridine(13) synthase TruD, partial [Hydrogenimonas sp.]
FLADIPAPGSRRYAWVWPTDIEGRYKKEEWHYELHFTLPKGSYATVLIEMLGNREFSAASQS